MKKVRQPDGTIPETILHRKGALKGSDIPVEVLVLLQQGKLASANLTEWLAVDHKVLLRHVMRELELQHDEERMLEAINTVEPKVMKLIPAIAKAWHSLFAEWEGTEAEKGNERRLAVYEALSLHVSDGVRCWAAYIIGTNEQMPLEVKLNEMKAFAADEHFGVRELAWMAVRDSIIAQLEQSLQVLLPWVSDENANIRRFAIEAIRPVGVWAKHIHALKERPELALPLLQPLLADPSKYVQDSVSNWLNDLSKSQPEWVKECCEKWADQSDSKATKRIITRALRTIEKREAR